MCVGEGADGRGAHNSTGLEMLRVRHRPHHRLQGTQPHCAERRWSWWPAGALAKIFASSVGRLNTAADGTGVFDGLNWRGASGLSRCHAGVFLPPSRPTWFSKTSGINQPKDESTM